MGRQGAGVVADTRGKPGGAGVKWESPVQGWSQGTWLRPPVSVRSRKRGLEDGACETTVTGWPRVKLQRRQRRNGQGQRWAVRKICAGREWSTPPNAKEKSSDGI